MNLFQFSFVQKKCFFIECLKELKVIGIFKSKGNLFQYNGPAYERLFNRAFVVLFGCINLKEEDLVFLELWSAKKNSLAIKIGQVFLKK